MPTCSCPARELLIGGACTEAEPLTSIYGFQLYAYCVHPHTNAGLPDSLLDNVYLLTLDCCSEQSVQLAEVLSRDQAGSSIDLSLVRQSKAINPLQRQYATHSKAGLLDDLFPSKGLKHWF